MMKEHFELVEVKPVFGFFLVQVVIAIAGAVPERLEIAGGVQQEASRSLGVDHACVNE